LEVTTKVRVGDGIVVYLRNCKNVCSAVFLLLMLFCSSWNQVQFRSNRFFLLVMTFILFMCHFFAHPFR